MLRIIKTRSKSSFVIFKRAIHSSIDNEAFDLAAESAFYVFMGIFPFLMFLVAMFGLIGQSESTFSEIISSVNQLLPKEIINTFNVYLYNFVYKSNHEFFSLSILVLIWTASMITAAILKSVSRAYRLQDNSPWIINKLYAVLLIIGFGILFFGVSAIYFIIPSAEKLVSAYLPQITHRYFLLAANNISFPLVFGFILLTINLLYILSTKFKVKFRFIWPGAFFATIIVVLISWLFGVYLNHFSSYNKIYGGLATIVIFLWWLQAVNFVFIFGCEINHQLMERHLAKKNEIEKKMRRKERKEKLKEFRKKFKEEVEQNV